MFIDQILFKKHLEKGEEVLYAVHKHWYVLMKPVLEISFFGFVLPWSLYAIGLRTPLFLGIAVIWSLIAYLRFLYLLLDWYSDAWLITNMSVITVQWNGFFNNSSARISFEDVEGAAYEIKGIVGTLYRFGNITMRLASGSNFILKNAAKPKEAELALARFQDIYMKKRSFQDSKGLKTLLSDLVSHHVRGAR
ncbi:hypothetical protein IPJ72_04935 [Candidatus Peregrinibacteria bacterium]|nr:MAG: hypothetical protein IPJ72_04935 [Candidatus Peregrinibacteria bacterium]